MSTRFWLLGTGNSDASTTTNWAATSGGTGGQSVPVAGDDVTFDGNSGGGTVTITATATCRQLDMSAFTGTLNVNGQTINMTNGVFTVSGTSTRTLTLGAATINCAGWSALNTTNLTFNANTSTINVTSFGLLFTGGGLTYNNVSLQELGGSSAFNGVNTFANLTLSNNGNQTNKIQVGANQTITGTLTITGNSTKFRVFISSNTLGTARTLTAATVIVTNADFQDITGAGAGSWNLSAITGGSGDCGGNSGITFTTPSTQHWTNASSGSWSVLTNWTSRIPLPQDTAVMDSAFGTSQTVTVDMPRLPSIDFTGATWTTALTWAVSSAVSIFGSLTLISGLTMTGTLGMTFGGRSGCTIKSNGVTFTPQFLMDCVAGTYTLQDDFNSTSTSQTQLTSGTFNDGGFNVTFTSVNASAATLTLTMGAGTWTITGTGVCWQFGGTLNANTANVIKFTDSSNTTITVDLSSGPPGTAYGTMWFARGASTASITFQFQCSFYSIKDTGTAAHSLLFGAGTTFSFTGPIPFQVTGNGAGNEISINSTTTGTHTLSAGSGSINCDYLNIQHSIATGGAGWYAGANSINNQATVTAGSGWIFTAQPPPAGIIKDAFYGSRRPRSFGPGLAR